MIAQHVTNIQLILIL